MSDTGLPELTRAHERLRDELDDDGVALPGSSRLVDLTLAELQHARRPPRFENRSSVYGSFVLPGERSLVEVDNLVEVIDLTMPIEQARRFSDGRSAFVVRHEDGRLQLACFRRTIEYEADLVEIEAATGASIVQRTIMGVTRVFTPTGAVEFDGHRWRLRPSARVYLPAVASAVPEASRTLLQGLLDLAVHWLSPARIGATFLLDLDPVPHDDHGLDLSASVDSPMLSVMQRHHYPALFAVLSQTDLATLVAADGAVGQLGVGLRSSDESELAVRMERGMRHRSAARYTFDHHHTVAFVVSEDGPVTLFRRGHPVEICAGG